MNTPDGDQQLRVARAYLLGVAEPPACALTEFVARLGPVDAAERVRAGEVPDDVAGETVARRGQLSGAAQLEHAESCGARLLVPEDDEWPAWPLLSLEVAAERGVTGMTAPLGIWAWGAGSLAGACERAVTMVGSRAATSYGEYAAAEWAYHLASEEVTICSGAAYGIDAAAHRGALACGGTTVAVLGCGLVAGYPAGHDVLFRRIAEQGLVLSEYPLATPPARHRFLVRNRLLAALSAGTVVIEADVRSGARNTAGTAAKLGKSLMAVPGPITSRTSMGCHEMIRSQQATLVSSAEEVAEMMGTLGVDLAQSRTGGTRRTDGLSATASRVHDALDPRHGKSVEELAMASGIAAAKVRAQLCELELDGFSKRDESGWLRIEA